jgi:hypothetical protein
MASTASPTATSRPMASGGMLFAATIMILSGLFQFFMGIGAIAKDSIFLGTPNYVFKFDTTAWGWIHLILGLLVAITGFCVMIAATWARIVGIGLVVLQAIGTFMFLPYFPFWALAILALDVFIIWALAAGPISADQMDDMSYVSVEDAEYARARRR